MDIKKQVAQTVDTIKDTVNETLHSNAAKAEQTRREVEGETMTPGEKVASVVNQAKNTVAAGLDRAKIDARKDI
jgi:uncharacterized protein YaaN involved in tellurite resistance